MQQGMFSFLGNSPQTEHWIKVKSREALEDEEAVVGVSAEEVSVELRRDPV